MTKTQTQSQVPDNNESSDRGRTAANHQAHKEDNHDPTEHAARQCYAPPTYITLLYVKNSPDRGLRSSPDLDPDLR